MELKIALEGIEVINFEVKNKPPELNSEIFNFDLSVNVSLNPEQRLGISLTKVIIKGFNATIELGHIELMILYKIENFAEVFPVMNDGKFTVPLGVKNLIDTTSISTVRGVLFSMLKGTYLHKAILPIIDMRKLIEQPHSIT